LTSIVPLAGGDDATALGFVSIAGGFARPTTSAAVVDDDDDAVRGNRGFAFRGGDAIRTDGKIAVAVTAGTVEPTIGASAATPEPAEAGVVSGTIGGTSKTGTTPGTES
jgi:hypothetical protein